MDLNFGRRDELKALADEVVSIAQQLSAASATRDEWPESERDLWSERFEGTRYLGRTAKQVLDAADGRLVSGAVADQLGAALDSLKQQLVLYRDTADLGHAERVVGQDSDLVVETLARLIVPQPSEAVSLVRDEVGDLVERESTRLRDLGDQARKLSEQLSSIASQAEAASSQSSGSLAQVGERLNQLENRIAEQEPRLDTSIANYEQQFSESQNRRSEAFNEELASAQSARSELVDELRELVRAEREERELRARALETDLLEQRSRAEAIVQAIAATGMTAGYSERGKTEKDSADHWRKVTVALSLGAIVVLVWAVLVHATDDLNSGGLAAKIGLSAAIATLAGFAGAQARHHRAAADDASMRAISLASIQPYLKDLDEPKQQALLEYFAAILLDPRPATLSQSRMRTRRYRRVDAGADGTETG